MSDNTSSPNESQQLPGFTGKGVVLNSIPGGLSRRTMLLLVLSGVAFVAVFSFFIYLYRGLPDLTDLENVNPAQASQLLSADGKVIHELYIKSRIWISYDKIPGHVIQATLATEDRDFFDHWGIAMRRVPGAIWANVSSLRFSQGFSTITMQVARNLYVKKIGFERNLSRKLREIITALQIERTYSKREIMEMYLNLSYFGRGAYGLQTAARKFFNKDASELTIEEGAYLVGSLKGPNNYQPPQLDEQQLSNAHEIITVDFLIKDGPADEENWKRKLRRSMNRRNLVLNNMVVCDYIKEAAYDSLKFDPVITEPYEDRPAIAPYFTEYVRIQLNELQKILGINVYEDGLRIYTTLDLAHQSAMDSALALRMPDIQTRNTASLQSWKKRENIPDSVFQKKSTLQVAMVSIDHATGHILAMVGGRDFDNSKFNRATQARRQPGSTFKPFLYATAIDNGYTPADQLLNQPVVLINPDDTRWTPENFDNKVGGLTTLREGLRNSINLIAARLILEVDPVNVVEYARRMGLTTDIRPFPSLAMGSAEVIPIELVSAFGVFANSGVLVERVSILKIEDRYGNLLWEHQPKRIEALNRSTAYIITKMIEDAINNGTGGSSRWRWNFTPPAAGKTGTTNDYSDAWFMGFTPRFTAGVWVGLDDHTLKMGRAGTGSETALPFWATYMKLVHEKLNLPNVGFRQPPDVITLNICRDSNKIATNFCPNVIPNELFKLDNHPGETCDLHPGSGSTRKRSGVIF